MSSERKLPTEPGWYYISTPYHSGYYPIMVRESMRTPGELGVEVQGYWFAVNEGRLFWGPRIPDYSPGQPWPPCVERVVMKIPDGDEPRERLNKIMEILPPWSESHRWSVLRNELNAYLDELAAELGAVPRVSLLPIDSNKLIVDLATRFGSPSKAGASWADVRDYINDLLIEASGDEVKRLREENAWLKKQGDEIESALSKAGTIDESHGHPISHAEQIKDLAKNRDDWKRIHRESLELVQQLRKQISDLTIEAGRCDALREEVERLTRAIFDAIKQLPGVVVIQSDAIGSLNNSVTSTRECFDSCRKTHTEMVKALREKEQITAVGREAQTALIARCKELESQLAARGTVDEQWSAAVKPLGDVVAAVAKAEAVNLEAFATRLNSLWHYAGYHYTGTDVALKIVKFYSDIACAVFAEQQSAHRKLIEDVLVTDKLKEPT